MSPVFATPDLVPGQMIATPLQRLLRREPRSGRVLSMGCRGYLAELEIADQVRVLRQRGRPRRFATLDAARRALRRRGVPHAPLIHRDAGEELG